MKRGRHCRKKKPSAALLRVVRDDKYKKTSRCETAKALPKDKPNAAPLRVAEGYLHPIWFRRNFPQQHAKEQEPNATPFCRTTGCNTRKQKGCEGFCKKCFRRHFPEQHAKKQEQRRGKCVYCGETKELQSGGVCKPCRHARSCESCSAVNMALSPKTCGSCETVRDRLGAKRKRLAMWCLSCYSESQRASGKCHKCFSCE